MAELGNINELETSLNNWGKRLMRAALIVDGTITAVDETAYTCDVLVGDATYSGVPLKTITNTQSSFIEIPKLNTDCLICFKNNSIQCPQIFSIHECEKILIKVGDSVLNITDGLFQFNGGDNDGMVLINELITKINRLENAFNHHTHLTAGPGSPVPPTVLAPFTDTIPITPLTTKTDLENTKITQ